MIRSVGILDAPCAFCGYSGAGYWQSKTHKEYCPWYNIGGEVERFNQLKVVLGKFKEYLALLDEAKCPECGGEMTVPCESCKGEKYPNYPNGMPNQCGNCGGIGMYGCPTCKGTGNRYELALIDRDAELPNCDVDIHLWRDYDADMAYQYCRDAHKGANFHKVIRI